MTPNQTFITSMACFVGSMIALYWIGRAMEWYELRQRAKIKQKT